MDFGGKALDQTDPRGAIDNLVFSTAFLYYKSTIMVITGVGIE